MNALVETYVIFKQLILHQELNLVVGLRCTIISRSLFCYSNPRHSPTLINLTIQQAHTAGSFPCSYCRELTTLIQLNNSTSQPVWGSFSGRHVCAYIPLFEE